MAVQHVTVGGGGKPRGVGIQDHEQRVIGQNAADQLYQPIQAFLDDPAFPAGASAEGGGIQDHRIVTVAAADLSLDELGAVVHNVTNTVVGNVGKRRVLLGAGNHALGGIYVANEGARLGRRYGSTAGICKQIQQLDLSACVLDEIGKPIPVGRLLGEQARMLKAHGGKQEFQVAVGDHPFLGDLFFHPFAAALVTAAVDAPGLFPFGTLFFASPNDLGVGTDENMISPFFQPFTVSGVQQSIVFPIFCYKHQSSSLSKVSCSAVLRVCSG